MDEHVNVFIIRADKAVTLVRIEPFYGCGNKFSASLRQRQIEFFALERKVFLFNCCRSVNAKDGENLHPFRTLYRFAFDR